MSEEKDSPSQGSRMTPYGRSLLKALGGSELFFKLTPEQVSQWGLERPESVLNLIPDEKFVEAAARLPVALLRKTDEQLVELAGEAAPTRVDKRMRLAFWDAYENAAKNLDVMNLESLALGTGVISWRVWSEQVRGNEALLAWVLSPPAHYRVALRESLDLGLSRLNEIMSLPLRDPHTKKLNTEVAKLIIAAFKLIDQRLNGAVTQRMVSLHADMGKAPEGTTGLIPEALDKKIAELEAALAAQPSHPPVVEVLPPETKEF